MPEQARLRVHGHGKVEVELVTDCLADLKYAYDAVTVFISAIERVRRVSRDFPFPPYPLWTPRLGRYIWEVPTPKRLSSFVPRSQHLVLNAVQVNSPGFWEFLGSLNVLEVMRKYLNDRHERRKDREYRESAEHRRMVLENIALESIVLKERIRIARDIGASDSDLAPFLNELIYKPLSALDRYQDKRIIEGAELLSLSDERTE